MNNNETEIWKKLNGYSMYEISNMGRIKSIESDIIIAKRLMGKYQCVRITNDNKKKTREKVRYLVAKTFVKNDDPTNKLKVDHINNIPTDDRACNLIWVVQVGDM